MSELLNLEIVDYVDEVQSYIEYEIYLLNDNDNYERENQGFEGQVDEQIEKMLTTIQQKQRKRKKNIQSLR